MNRSNVWSTIHAEFGNPLGRIVFAGRPTSIAFDQDCTSVVLPCPAGMFTAVLACSTGAAICYPTPGELNTRALVQDAARSTMQELKNLFEFDRTAFFPDNSNPLCLVVVISPSMNFRENLQAVIESFVVAENSFPLRHLEIKFTVRSQDNEDQDEEGDPSASRGKCIRVREDDTIAGHVEVIVDGEVVVAVDQGDEEV